MNCDLCGSDKRTPLHRPEVCVCDDCGFVYVPERRSADEIAASWTKIYRDGGYDPDWPGVRARLFYVAEWLDQNIGLEGKSVLDIGAGNGFFLDEIRKRGAHPVGLDPDKENCEKIRAMDIFCHEGAWEDVTAGTFDLVTINWTLENCGDCLGMLKYAATAAPMVSVATGSRILVPFKKPYKSYMGVEDADLHCFRWSENSLRRAMAESGLKQKKLNDFMDNDVMVALSERGDVVPLYNDDPQDVISFFDAWHQLF